MTVDNSGSNPYDIHQEKAHSDVTTTDAPTGAGGGDMTIWVDDRTAQLTGLVLTDFTNASAYSLPTGVVDSGLRPYDQGFPEHEVDHSDVPGGVPAGIGGGQMEIWDADRVTQLSELITAPFTDASTFGLPNGVVDAAARSYDVGFPTSEVLHSDPFPGVELGQSAFATLSGEVTVIKEGVVGELLASDAAITLDPPTQPAVTAAADRQGGYQLSLPELNATYGVTVSHPLLPSDVSEEVDIGAGDHEEDFTLLLTGVAGGLAVGRTASFG